MKIRRTTVSRPKWHRLGKVALSGATAAAMTWAVVTGGPSGTPATADAHTKVPGAPVADDAPGFAIEYFAYPQADKIRAEKGITLKRGDGHILLADCAGGPGLLEVWARAKEKICFRVTGNSGHLSLEIPSVFGVKGNDYATRVDMTAGSERKSFDITKNAWTGVGESADEQGRDFMLMEIRTAK